MRIHLWLSLLVILLAPVPAQTFGGPFPQIVIPDAGPAFCLGMVSPVTRVVTVPLGLPAIPSINVTLGISHGFIGDVRFTISHGGILVTLLGPPAPCGVGDGSDLLGLYTFDDGAPAAIGVAALMYADTAVIPPGPYIGTGLLAPFLGTPPDGPWTFTVWDTAGGVTGAIYDARVSFGMPTSFPSTAR